MENSYPRIYRYDLSFGTVYKWTSVWGSHQFETLGECSRSFFNNFQEQIPEVKSAFDLNVFLYDRLIDNMDMNGHYDTDYSGMVTMDEIKAWFGPYGDKVRAEMEERAEAEA